MKPLIDTIADDFKGVAGLRHAPKHEIQIDCVELRWDLNLRPRQRSAIAPPRPLLTA